jgi:integrase
MHLKGGRYYYVTTTLPRRWIPLDTDLAKARVLWAQIENGMDGDDQLFVNLLDQYLVSKKFQDLAPSSRRTYESAAKKLRVVFESVPINAIRPSHVAQWIDNHHSPNQANIGKAIMANVFDQAIRRGICETNPAREIRPAKTETRERYITDEEFLAIHEKANDVVKVAMDICYITSARISDILKISLQDVRPDGLYVKQQKTGKKQLFEMTTALADAIDRAKKLPRPVRGMSLICTRRGTQYSYATFNDFWLEAVRSAKVEDAHFHDIRAKAATDAKRIGLDHQALLGHASKAMSDRYVKIREVERVTTMPDTVRKVL